MKVSLPAVVVPLIAAGACALIVSVATWEDLRSALLPTISIIAAAVLVRLARGLPFTNPDHFTLPQFRDVAEKLESNARKLRALIVICLVTLGAYVAFPSFGELLARHLSPELSVTPYVDRLLSGIMALLTAYCFVRVIEVVQSDVGLLRLQSKIIEGTIARKNATAFESKVEKAETKPIAGHGGFGVSA